MVQRRKWQVGSFGKSHVPCIVAGDGMTKFPDAPCERLEGKQLDLELAQRVDIEVGPGDGNLLRTLESTNYVHRFDLGQLRSA